VGEAFDFIAACRAGAALMTRDRRQVRITRLAAEEGLIFGEVAMAGPCAWHRDGRWRDAPAGAAGPLDLMPPPGDGAAKCKTVSMKDALAGDGSAVCCD
jgi:hypothetical protein